jgi:uncharacterized protein with PIN domain
MEECDGIATGNLKIQDDESLMEYDVCSSCYAELQRIYKDKVIGMVKQ